MATQRLDMLVHGGTLLAADPLQPVRRADVAIVDGRIAAIGSSADLTKTYGDPLVRIDATDRHVIPGLVNAHTHLFQVALRGLGDGLDLHAWRDSVTSPAYRVLTSDDCYWYTALATLENIRAGVTTVVNFQSFPNDLSAQRRVADAIGATGIRAIMVKTSYGQGAAEGLLSTHRDAIDELRATFEEFHGSFDDRIRCWAGVATAMHAPGDWIAEAHAIAKQHGSGLHVHVAETSRQVDDAMEQLGQTEVRYLDALGVIDDRFHAVHGVAISQADCEILADRRASIIHCPVSNAYLGSGVADIVGAMQAGVNIALGTDGAATNNNQDMFLVMRLASLMSRASRGEPGVMSPGEVLEMATLRGARASGFECGSLDIGALADLVVLDLGDLHNQPLHRPISALVNSVHAHDVETVIIAGRVVMDHRRFPGVDEGEIVAQCRARARRLVVDAALDRSGRWPWV